MSLRQIFERLPQLQDSGGVSVIEVSIAEVISTFWVKGTISHADSSSFSQTVTKSGSESSVELSGKALEAV